MSKVFHELVLNDMSGHQYSLFAETSYEKRNLCRLCILDIERQHIIPNKSVGKQTVIIFTRIQHSFNCFAFIFSINKTSVKMFRTIE